MTVLSRVVTVASWAALVAFTVLSVGSALLGQSVFMSTRSIEALTPWASLDPSPATRSSNEWVGDTLDSVTPSMLMHQHYVEQGTFAQWNPYVVGGDSGASVPDAAPFSPLSLPWYVLPETFAPGAVKVLEIAAITLGMSLLLRRFGLPSAAWALGALVYSSSAFMVAWTNWPQTRTAAMIPLLLWAVDRAVTKRRWRDATPLALVTAAMVAGGFPSVAGYAMYAAAAWAVTRTLSITRVPRDVARAAMTSLGGVAIGAALMAWQLLPFAHQTLNVVDLEIRQQSPEAHLEIAALATAVVPEIYGGPIAHFWGLGRNPIETFSYVGAVTFVLVAVAVLVRPPTRDGRFLRAFTLAGLGLTMLLVYGGGAPLGVAQQLPVFSNNHIGRATVMFGFFSALAAASGYASVIGRRAGPAPASDGHHPGATAPELSGGTPATARPRTAVTRTVRAGQVAVVLAAVVAMVLIVENAAVAAPPDRWPDVRGAIVRAAVLLVLGASVVSVAALHPRTWSRALAGTVVPVLIVVPALSVVSVWWPKGPTEYLYPPTPAHDFLAANLGHERYVSLHPAMLPGTSSAYRLRAANGHAWHTDEWTDMLEAADPDVLTTRTYSTLKNLETVGSPALDRLAVRYAVVSPGRVLPGVTDAGAPPGAEVVRLAEGAVARAEVASPFRGIFITAPEGWVVGPDGAVITVTVRGEDGEVVTSTDLTVEHERPAMQLWVPLAGEVAPGRHVQLEVGQVGGETPLALLADASGELVVDVRRPPDDGLRVAHTNGAVVLERLTALDRFRWAGREVVVEDEERAVRLLASGEVPDDTVLVERAEDAITPAGSTAELSVRRDGTDVLQVTVDADGPGWLVVADALRRGGWSASVDGEEAPLVDVDHALAAVPVPSGLHEVTLRYEAPGLRAGLAVALVAGLVIALSHVVPALPARRTASRAADPEMRPRRSGDAHVRHDGAP